MKKIMLLGVTIVFFVFLVMLFWIKKDNFDKEVYMNKYIKNFIFPDNWIDEETLINKVSIKNTEKFDVVVRVSFDNNFGDAIDYKIYNNNWIKIDDDREYYYYKYIISPNEEISLNQYLFLENEDNKDKVGDIYSIDTNIEIVDFKSYSEVFNVGKDFEIKMMKGNDLDSSKIEEEMLFNEKIERRLNRLSLDEKIGQMMIISLLKNNDRLKNDKEEYDVLDLLSKVKPGGVILETKDFKNRNVDEIIDLTKTLKSSSDIPMIISVDQEGGRVQRLMSFKDKDINGFTYIQTMEDIGFTNDVSIAKDVGILIGMELNALGINMDFAPVIDTLYVDSNVIGDRSFGSDVNLVKEMGVALGDGLKNRGIIPVYKHFPNHGSTSTDSHDGLPLVRLNRDDLLKNDLIPFKEVINKGASLIMVGHLYYPEISKEPASLSKEIINDLLKEELNYGGLVITDSLRMGAIVNKFGEKEVYEMAINAGVDLLLMPYNPDYAVDLIKMSIKEGKVTEEQINNSVRKILKLKYSELNNDEADKSLLDTSLYKELSDKIGNIND